jgi:hypothetical protein
MTRVAEMRALGIPVALGQDCVMDPWYGLGGADMLDVAHMAVHGAPMTSREAIRSTFDAVTETPARILGLEGYGVTVGAHADVVLLQAHDPIEAVRLRATRLLVMRRGKIIARTPPEQPRFHWTAGRPISTPRLTPRALPCRRTGAARATFDCGKSELALSSPHEQPFPSPCQFVRSSSRWRFRRDNLNFLLLGPYGDETPLGLKLVAGARRRV